MLWCLFVVGTNLQVSSRLLLLDMDLVPFWANHDVIIISHFKWKYVAHNGDLHVTSRNYLKTLPWHQNNRNWSTSISHQVNHQHFVHPTVSIPPLRCPHHLGWRWLEVWLFECLWQSLRSPQELKQKVTVRKGQGDKILMSPSAVLLNIYNIKNVVTFCAPWHTNPRFKQVMISGMYRRFLSTWEKTVPTTATWLKQRVMNTHTHTCTNITKNIWLMSVVRKIVGVQLSSSLGIWSRDIEVTNVLLQIQPLSTSWRCLTRLFFLSGCYHLFCSDLTHFLRWKLSMNSTLNRIRTSNPWSWSSSLWVFDIHPGPDGRTSPQYNIPSNLSNLYSNSWALDLL